MKEAYNVEFDKQQQRTETYQEIMKDACSLGLVPFAASSYNKMVFLVCVYGYTLTTNFNLSGIY